MTLRLERLATRLETERLSLRAFAPSDATSLLRVVDANRAHLERWLVWPTRMTTARAIAAWAERPYDASEAYRLGIYERTSGELVGAAGLKVRSVDPAGAWRWVDIGYWLAAAALGSGYATEAARRLAIHAFDDLESPRLEIRTEPENTPSIRVAERLGFRHEGTLRDVGHRRGGPIDLAVFALIGSERPRLDRPPAP